MNPLENLVSEGAMLLGCKEHMNHLRFELGEILSKAYKHSPELYNSSQEFFNALFLSEYRQRPRIETLNNWYFYSMSVKGLKWYVEREISDIYNE